jgi:hypothetical protein
VKSDFDEFFISVCSVEILRASIASGSEFQPSRKGAHLAPLFHRRPVKSVRCLIGNDQIVVPVRYIGIGQNVGPPSIDVLPAIDSTGVTGAPNTIGSSG